MTETKDTFELATPHGPARVHLHRVDRPVAALVLGHGAAGGIAAPDLSAAKDVALGERLTVALIEQPYRVAGRRSPAPAKQLDVAWLAVIEQLRARELAELPLIAGGRSMGARVACRTGAEARAMAVLCLAFPLLPPRRSGPPQSRLAELDQVTVPTLVVQGDRDRFGMPPGAPGRIVAPVPGDHSLRTDTEAVGEAIQRWLDDVLATI
jgi:uncharacterized protein